MSLHVTSITKTCVISLSFLKQNAILLVNYQPSFYRPRNAYANGTRPVPRQRHY